MAEIKELKLSLNFWEWLIDKTNYKFNGFLIHDKDGKEVFRIYSKDFDMFDWLLHDIIYQAIDNINSERNYIIHQFDLHIKVIANFYEEYKGESFSINKCIDETNARIAALNWIYIYELRR